MPAKIKIYNYTIPVPEDKNCIKINTLTFMGKNELHPIGIENCTLYDGMVAKNMHNAWHYSQVYENMIDAKGDPSIKYFEWALNGWNEPKFGKPQKCKIKYHYWAGKKIDIIPARKQIYTPLYIKNIIKTQSFKQLQELYSIEEYTLYFVGLDVHRENERFTLTELLNNITLPWSHLYCLKMLLTKDNVITQIKL
jgi:hypothetical protein